LDICLGPLVFVLPKLLIVLTLSAPNEGFLEMRPAHQFIYQRIYYNTL